MRLEAAFAASLLMAGCAPVPVQVALPPSGVPEVTVLGKTRQQVVDAIIHRQLANGWELKSVGYSVLVFSRKAKGLAADLVFGDQAASMPEVQATLSLADVDNGFRISAREVVISDPGTSNARTTDLTGSGKEALNLQAALNEIKDALAAGQ